MRAPCPRPVNSTGLYGRGRVKATYSSGDPSAVYVSGHSSGGHDSSDDEAECAADRTEEQRFREKGTGNQSPFRAECAHDADFNRLDKLGAPTWYDLASSRGNNIDGANAGPDERGTKNRDNGGTNRSANRRRTAGGRSTSPTT